MTAAGDAAASLPPLSVAQEALWYRTRLAPTQITYNEAISIRKDGPLDVAALRSAFGEIVRRHQAWRTAYDTVDGQPVQVVGPPPEFELAVLDLSHLDHDQAERRAVSVVAATARIPYDVRAGPLVRPRLIRFSADHHRLYLAMHHLAFDGASVNRVVLGEIVALYDAFAAGVAPSLPEPRAQYSDYAVWEQAWIDGPRAQRRLAYWHRRLPSFPALSLPPDRRRAAAPAFRGGMVSLAISREDRDRLRAIGQGIGATLFQVLAAIWALLMSRHSGQQQVVFATVADMRQRPELQSVVGYCVSPLVMAIDVSGDPSFSELAIRVRNELLDGLDQLVPFERVVRDLPSLGTSANPIYQTMIVLEPAAVSPDPNWSLHQLESELGDAVGNTKLDLELQLDERPDGRVRGRLIYDRDLRDRATVERMIGHWDCLIAGVTADPAAPVSSLEILTPSERHRQLVEWNATTTTSAHTRHAIDELIADRASRVPAALAVSDSRETIDYAELDRRADAVAERLAGAREVTLLAEPSVNLVVEALGALKAGSRHLVVRAGGQSTPVEVRHAPAVNLATALAAELEIGPADTVLLLASMVARDPVTSLWMPLIAGARIAVASEDAAADGARLSRLIAEEGVTFLHATPSGWSSLIDTGLRSVRGLRALSGGEPLSRELADAILKRSRVLWNAYGVPETSGYCTLARVEATGPVTIGGPLANIAVYVLDDHARPVPVGVTGELVITGDAVSPAGPNAADENRLAAESLDARATYRTGMRVRWRSDGQLEPVAESAPASEATTGIEPV